MAAWAQLPWEFPPPPAGLPDLSGRQWDVERKGQNCVVRAVPPAEMGRAVDIIVDAMGSTPAAVWSDPDDDRRIAFQTLLYGDSFGRQPGTWGYVLEADDYKAVCAWMRSDMPLSYPTPTTPNAIIARDEHVALEKRVMDDAPVYFYLVSLVSCVRRQGYARAVLQPILQIADELDLPCYLDDVTGNAGVRAFYESLGFCALSSASPGGFPVLGMRRERPSIRCSLWHAIPWSPPAQPTFLGDFTGTTWTVDRKGATSVVRAVPLDELQRVVDVVMAAFIGEPIMQWCAGSDRPSDRIEYIVRLCDSLIRQVATWGYICEIDGFKAVAAWATSSQKLLFDEKKTKNGAALLGGVFDEMEKRIMGDAPQYLHLNILASVVPGYARALVEPMLRIADERGLPCYLEDTTDKPIPQVFYESLGFVKADEHVLGGTRVVFRRREPIKKT